MKVRRKAALVGSGIKQPIEDQHLFPFNRSSQQRIAADFRNAQVKTHVIGMD